MRLRLLVVVGLALMVDACSSGTGQTPEPAESVPPAPEAPAGWSSVTSFGGVAGNGLTGATFSVADAVVAVNASCLGGGTLVVIVAADRIGVDHAQTAPSAVFPCGDGDQVRTSRVELADAPSGDVTASAYVIEGGGTIRHAAFNVSVEQPDSPAAH